LREEHRRVGPKAKKQGKEGLAEEEKEENTYENTRRKKGKEKTQGEKKA